MSQGYSESQFWTVKKLWFSGNGNRAVRHHGWLAVLPLEPPDANLRLGAGRRRHRFAGRGVPVSHWRVVENMWNAYFWVDDVEAVYEEFQDRGAIIDYTLHLKPYGVKEFGVQDLDGHDLAFGEIVDTIGWALPTKWVFLSQSLP